MGDERGSRDDRRLAFIALGVMVAIMWIVELIDRIDGGDLDGYGIRPRSVTGLEGVVTAPFLHASWGHLIGNTVPFVILGAIIAFDGLVRLLETTAIVMVVAGLGTWLIGPAHSVHIGASGVVFGYATYVMARGVFSRSILELAIGAVVLFLYAGTLLSALVPTEGISWQSHLFGGIGGVLAAWMLDRPRRTGAPADAPVGSS
jgi:membrane associated rhomboid family serine protease